MNELLEYAKTIISYLEQNADRLDMASQQALGELLQNILQVIASQEEGAEAPTEPQKPAIGDIGQAMPSSNVEGFAYDDNSGRLLVRFLGQYPNRDGAIYAYEGVPKEIFDLFRSGSIPARTDGKNKWGKWWKGKIPSIGASLFSLIKNRNYPYQRLT